MGKDPNFHYMKENITLAMSNIQDTQRSYNAQKTLCLPSMEM